MHGEYDMAFRMARRSHQEDEIGVLLAVPSSTAWDKRGIRP
jgi:hypothetical protein